MANNFWNLGLEMYINMLNLNLILCSLISPDYFKIVVTTQKKIFVSLRIGIYISCSCAPMAALKSNI